MRGAMPQKGLKMKLSLNCGSFFNNTFVISTEHSRQLSNFLWDWMESLPREILGHVEIITVNPCPMPFGRGIVIRVILSWGCTHHTGDGGTESLSLKNEFQVSFFYSPHSDCAIGEHVKDLKNNLNEKLLATLKDERNTYEPHIRLIDSLVGSMKHS